MPTRLERLVVLKQEIDRAGYPTVEALCRMLEIQPRTLYDDIRLLREQMGLEIKYDRSRNGYYAAPNQKLPMFDLSVGEVFALTLAKDLLVQYSGTPFQPVLGGALEKIQQRLPEKVRMEIADLEAIVDFGNMPSVPFSRKMFMELHKACQKQICVRLTYQSASKGEQTERTIEPYRIIQQQTSWYLAAFCQLRNEMRLFALHRIREYETTTQAFVPMDKEKLEDWLSSPLFIEHREAPVEVSIQFSVSSSRYITEKNWHPSQKLQTNSDGSCVLSFTTSSLEEVKRWVLMYGSTAEVLTPEALRVDVLRELKAAVERYSVATCQ